MSSTPREIGTLIVVVLRANHLPNKRHIGKQDPYCLVTVNGEKRRTKAIKRGGQHPEWDEEIRFTLFEDVNDVLARTAHGNGTPPPPPPKDNKKLAKVKGGKTMKVACYADDPREPDLIGDVEVDLTEVLTKGETDEWFTLSSKDKFAGKVYLELTFWSNEPPPEKKVTPKPSKNNKQYGGPGSFVPSGEFPPSRIASASATYNNHTRQSSDILPSSLRASSSAANLDLYVAPYERNRNSYVDNLTREFGEFGVAAPRRRESFPPVPGQYSQQPQYTGQSTFINFSSPYGYEPSLSDAPNGYSYDRPLTPNGQTPAHYPQSSLGALHGYPSQGYQHQPYEVASPISYQQTARGPRHSVPTASSGFIPLPQSSGFVSIASHVSEPSGFAPPLSHTPAPAIYNSQFLSQSQPMYPPPVSHTPVPQVNSSYLQQSASLSFHPQQSFSPSQSYNYNYGVPPSASAPPQQFISSPPSQPSLSPQPQQANSAPTQLYPPALSSPHEAPLSSSSPLQMAPANGQSSRPLPQQPQVVYAQAQVQPQSITTSHSLPPPGAISQTVNSYGSTQPGNIYPNNNVYSAIPPPPPPPIQYNTGPSVATSGANLPVPPPPPPLPPNPTPQPHRRASLPQPPVSYPQQHQQPAYQQPPPPPPPPPPPTIEYYGHNPLPPPPPPPLDRGMSQNDTYSHQSLPKPPAPVDEHGQWIHPSNFQQVFQAY